LSTTVATKLGSVHVDRVGDGPPVLLLHGISSSHVAFDAQVALASGYSLIRWDAPGYGLSEDPGAPPSLKDYADAAAQVLEALDATPAHVAGVSWGGLIAIGLALEQPASVKTLALISSTAGRGGNVEKQGEYSERIAALESEGIESWAAARAQRILGPSASDDLRTRVRRMIRDAVRLPGFSYAAATLTGTDHRARLHEINAPTLVLAGEDDSVTGVLEARVLADGISDSRLVTIPDAGHLTNQEQPLAVNAALVNLWAAEEGRSQ
jgi:3-oxoadipate enol-lactonase